MTGYAVPLYFKRRPSRLLVVFLVAIHSGALGVLPWLALPGAGGVFLALGIILSCYFGLRQQALLVAPRAIVGVSWNREEDCWYLYRRDGKECRGKLLSGYFVGLQAGVLTFVLGPWWRRESIILLPDNIDPPDALRRLRLHIQIRYP